MGKTSPGSRAKAGEERRDKQGRFKKGFSGNPRGTKEQPPEFKALVKEKSIPALERVIAIMESPDSPAAEVIKAARLVIEYAYGKPRELIDANVTAMQGDFVLEISQGADDGDLET